MKHIYAYILPMVSVVAAVVLLTPDVSAQGTKDLFNYSDCTIRLYDWDYGTTDGLNYGWGAKLRSTADGERHKIITASNATGSDPNVPITDLPIGSNTVLRLGTNRYVTQYDYDYYGNPVVAQTEYAKGGGVIFQYKVTQENAVILINYAAMLTNPMQDHKNAMNTLIGQYAWNPYMTQNSMISDVKTFYQPSDWQYQQPYVDFYLGVDGQELECTTLYQMLYDESGNRIDLSNAWKTKSFDISDGTKSYHHDSYYKDWSLMAVDLTPYIGSTISFVAEYRDCAMAGWYFFQEDKQKQYPQIYTCDDHHLARLYLNASCSPAAITLLNKDCAKRQITCSAPAGFASYKWFTTSNPETVLSTEQTCTYTYTTNGEENDLCCTVTSLMTNSCTPSETTMKYHFVNDCLEEATVNLTLCSCDLPYMWNNIACSETKQYVYPCATADGIADSITYLNLTVLTSTVNPMQKAVFCEGTAYNWKGHADFSSLTEAKTYYDTVFYSTPDSYGKRCPQYCYSLQLDMNPKKTVELDKTLCYDEAADFWSSHSFDKSLPVKSAEPIAIAVSETLPSLLTGCDSTTTYNLTLNPTTYGVDHRRICADILASEGFTWYGNIYHSVPAVAPVCTLTNVYDCDSIVTLDLQVQSVTSVEETTTWCLSELPDFSEKKIYPYTFAQDGHGLNVADTAGVETQGRYYIYHDTLRNMYGCDSVRYTLKAAVVRPVVMPAEVRYRCANDMMAGDDWHIEGWDEHNDKEEFEAMSYPGTYTDIRKSVSGCDSIIYTLQIIEYPAYARYKLSFVDPEPVDYRTKLGTVYIYEGEKFHCGENDYSEKGEYEEKTKTINGCDSVIVFTLEVLPNEEHRYDTVCYKMLPYVLTLPDGSNYSYSESGDYEHPTKSQQGKDLLVVLHLTVQSPETAVAEEAFISSEESYIWHGHEGFAGLTEPGLYHDTVYYTTGCDSIYYTLDLKVYNPSVKATVSADSVCADDATIAVRIITSEGEPVSADIVFSEKAHTVGFRDTLGINVAGIGETVCYLPMPTMPDDSYLRPDNYGFAVRITDIFGNITDHAASLAVLYPSWVVMQRWNDVLMVQNERYNGHYIFSAIRWYADGEPVEASGENNGYIYLPDRLDISKPYWAELTRADDGKTIRTCSIYPAVLDDKTHLLNMQVQLAPRYDGDYSRVAVTSNTSGTYQVFSSEGRRIAIGYFGSAYDSPDIVFPPSVAKGVYLITFISDKGEKVVHKWQKM